MPAIVDPKLLKRLEQAVAQLPPLTREVFLAHCVDALSYEQLAERTELSLQEVEGHLASAIYRLMTDLDQRKLSWWERWLR